MTTIQSAADFFYENAGSSYDPRTQTQEEGRRRCADDLARAEEWARDNGVRAEWVHDPDADTSWMDQEGFGGYDGRPFFGCVLYKQCEECGEWKATSQSLWSIDASEDDPYRRVVEAELAMELMDS